MLRRQDRRRGRDDFHGRRQPVRMPRRRRHEGLFVLLPRGPLGDRPRRSRSLVDRRMAGLRRRQRPHDPHRGACRRRLRPRNDAQHHDGERRRGTDPRETGRAVPRNQTQPHGTAHPGRHHGNARHRRRHEQRGVGGCRRRGRHVDFARRDDRNLAAVPIRRQHRPAQTHGADQLPHGRRRLQGVGSRRADGRQHLVRTRREGLRRPPAGRSAARRRRALRTGGKLRRRGLDHQRLRARKPARQRTLCTGRQRPRHQIRPQGQERVPDAFRRTGGMVRPEPQGGRAHVRRRIPQRRRGQPLRDRLRGLLGQTQHGRSPRGSGCSGPERPGRPVAVRQHGGPHRSRGVRDPLRRLRPVLRKGEQRRRDHRGGVGEERQGRLPGPLPPPHAGPAPRARREGQRCEALLPALLHADVRQKSPGGIGCPDGTGLEIPRRIHPPDPQHGGRRALGRRRNPLLDDTPAGRAVARTRRRAGLRGGQHGRRPQFGGLLGLRRQQQFRRFPEQFGRHRLLLAHHRRAPPARHPVRRRGRALLQPQRQTVVERDDAPFAGVQQRRGRRSVRHPHQHAAQRHGRALPLPHGHQFEGRPGQDEDPVERHDGGRT